MYLTLEINLGKIPDHDRLRHHHVAEALRRAATLIEKRAVPDLKPGERSQTVGLPLDNIGAVGHYQFHGSRRTK
jgi:hypothetical protein